MRACSAASFALLVVASQWRGASALCDLDGSTSSRRGCFPDPGAMQLRRGLGGAAMAMSQQTRLVSPTPLFAVDGLDSLASHLRGGMDKGLDSGSEEGRVVGRDGMGDGGGEGGGGEGGNGGDGGEDTDGEGSELTAKESSSADAGEGAALVKALVTRGVTVALSICLGGTIGWLLTRNFDWAFILSASATKEGVAGGTVHQGGNQNSSAADAAAQKTAAARNAQKQAEERAAASQAAKKLAEEQAAAKSAALAKEAAAAASKAEAEAAAKKAEQAAAAKQKEEAEAAAKKAEQAAAARQREEAEAAAKKAEAARANEAAAATGPAAPPPPNPSTQAPAKVGIGMVVEAQYADAPEGQQKQQVGLVVKKMIENGPAALTGRINVGDKLVAVGSTSVG